MIVNHRVSQDNPAETVEDPGDRGGHAPCKNKS